MRALVVSDLHLDPAQPAIAAQFHAFLRTEARAVDALYVLGDLFESWVGDDDREPQHRATIAALRAVADTGVALYFVPGNRDFLLGERFGRETGGTLLADPTLVVEDGRRVLLTHGDALCTDDVAYQKLRALVREPAFSARLLALGLARRKTLAAEARASSRAHAASQATMLMDVNPAMVERALRESGADVLVHGHTHRPGVHELEVDGTRRLRVVTGDWHAQGSVLRWDARGLELRTLPR